MKSPRNLLWNAALVLALSACSPSGPDQPTPGEEPDVVVTPAEGGAYAPAS